MRLLAQLIEGELILVDGATHLRFGDRNAPDALKVRVTVEDSRFYAKLLLAGSIGAAEAYMEGYWQCSDLAALVRIIARNKTVMMDMEKGWARIAWPINALVHWRRLNSLRGGRRNIAAHYDLSNEFFEQFLDETLTYSCAVFESDNVTLAEASVAKLDRVCRKLALTPADHVLEIGSGWGSFAIHAATTYGCQVTTTTLSQNQYELVQVRAREAGVGDRIRVLLKDYRELDGTFTKIASIEMVEAVGWKYLPTYFAKCSELLTPDGVMVLQSITIADQEYDRYKRSVDFINRYVFPGGCLPSVKAIREALRRATDMQLVHIEDITPHYAKTLRLWRERFYANLDRICALGFDDRFLRMWEYYLAYCEGGFLERVIGDVQLVIAKPASHQESTRAYLGGSGCA